MVASKYNVSVNLQGITHHTSNRIWKVIYKSKLPEPCNTYLLISKVGFNILSGHLDNNKVTSPFKNQCIQQAKPFQDTAGKIVFASKTVLYHKNNTLFENGLDPILNSCTDGIIVLSALNLTFSLRSKLARIAVNHIIQKKGLQLKCFQSGTKDIPNFKLLLDLKADALVSILNICYVLFHMSIFHILNVCHRNTK
nr:uncharacterized protein LOC124819006 [Hydra vulgaris]